MILGWCWALASPPGSAADDDFHLTSIWCAWGSSDTCKTGLEPGMVFVPETVLESPCFIYQGNAACVTTLTGNLVATDYFNASVGSYPGVYYYVLRLFVGPDVNRSVILMRMFNVALAAALLAAALAVCRPAPRRSVALAWAACIVPVGIFFVASTNPSSWVITGVGLFWAFLLTMIRSHPLSTARSRLALVGALATAALALGARSDSAVYLGISVVVVIILEWRHIRSRVARWLLVLVPIGMAMVALPFSLGRYAAMNLTFPGAFLPSDQPNPVLKTILELPAFILGIIGGQAPTWSQRDDPNNWFLEGYSSPGFNFGVGWVDVYNPSVSGVFATVSLAGIVFLGLRSYSFRKLTALTLVAAAFVAQVLFMRAAVAFTQTWGLQPRYFVPPLLLFVGLATLAYPPSRAVLNRVQGGLLVLLLTLGATISFLATMSRYTISQFYAYTNLGTEKGWWWPMAPSPELLLVVATLAGLGMYWGLVLYGTGRVGIPVTRSGTPATDRTEKLPS